MMLIGEADECQARFFGAFLDACPLDVCRDVGLSDLNQRRRQYAMAGPTLQSARRTFRAIEFSTRMAVIDGENEPASEFASNIFDPVQRHQVDLGFVELL